VERSRQSVHLPCCYKAFFPYCRCVILIVGFRLLFVARQCYCNCAALKNDIDMNNARYTQLEFVANGGFAIVNRALDTWTGQTVAIKFLRNPNPDSLQRFARERDMLTVHLSNPHVVDILDSCLDGPNPYLVLEFSSLGSLQDYVSKRRNWRRIAGWLLDISNGLTLIHERGDLLRDIKPSNLLRFRRGDGSELVKIVDFGVGQRIDNPCGQMTTSVFGTQGYIDPVAQATKTFTAASDIYSLGVTIRELSTGMKTLWFGVIHGPEEFRLLIGSMTDRDVKKRPTARQIFERVNEILQANPEGTVQHAPLTLKAAVQQPANGLGLLVGGLALFGLCLFLARE
jgi:serine/threonine protein kinase